MRGFFFYKVWLGSIGNDGTDGHVDSIKLLLNNPKYYGAPFSHLFTELKISPIEVHISAIQLQISPIHLKISSNQLEISMARRFHIYSLN